MVSSRALVVTAASTALVVGFGLSASASASGLLRLGTHNDAPRTTTLVNHGRGPALQLKTGPGAPPLTVSSSKRVAHLNAARLDGMRASALRTRVYIYRIGGDEDWGPDLVKVFPGLPPGEYLATYQMRMVLYAGGSASCWFTTATQSRAGYAAGSTGDYGALVLSGSVLLDAQQPITLHCLSGSAFDTIASDTSTDSRVTFLRVAPTQPRWATTYELRTGSSSGTSPSSKVTSPH